MTLLCQEDKILVAGSNGMVGSSICRILIKNGYNYRKKNLLTISRNELDLRDSKKVSVWFKNNRPEIVIIAAAKVGGILANQNKPVEFLLENLKIQNNLIENAFKYKAKRLLFLGSSCIYPKYSKQPIKENYLLNQSLEKSNQYYAIAKIAGLKLCEAYRQQYNFDTISLMPTNLYGPGDNYDEYESHVMASLIRKIFHAKMYDRKEIICWGSGSPLREFLYVDDLAEACIHTLKYWEPNKTNAPLDQDGNPLNWINIGSNFEISIKDLAYKISDILNYKGNIIWDKKMPDGTPRKKLDNSYINRLGWFAKTNLSEGIKQTIHSYSKNVNNSKN